MLDYLDDNRDRVLFAETPTLMYPRFGGLPPLDLHKHRFVMGCDGVYIEARNEIFEVRLQVSSFSDAGGITFPYGKPDEFIHLVNGQIPSELLDQVAGYSVQSGEEEWAGLIVWDTDNLKYDIYIPTVISKSSTHISYENELPDNLILAIDFHSHGYGRPYFSSTDTESDTSFINSFYLAGCLGYCNNINTVSIVTRYVINANLISKDWSKIFNKMDNSFFKNI